MWLLSTAAFESARFFLRISAAPPVALPLLPTQSGSPLDRRLQWPRPGNAATAAASSGACSTVSARLAVATLAVAVVSQRGGIPWPRILRRDARGFRWDELHLRHEEAGGEGTRKMKLSTQSALATGFLEEGEHRGCLRTSPHGPIQPSDQVRARTPRMALEDDECVLPGDDDSNLRALFAKAVAPTDVMTPADVRQSEKLSEWTGEGALRKAQLRGTGMRGEA